MRKLKDAVSSITKTFDDIGHAVDGVDNTADALAGGFKKLAGALKSMPDQQKKIRTEKGCWLLAAALSYGTYPNITLLRDECVKPIHIRKKRKDGRRYPGDNYFALGIINSAGIPIDVEEELDPEKEALYMGRVMDRLEVWEKRYYMDTAGNIKTTKLTDQERADIDEGVMNDIDTAINDPFNDVVQDGWLALTKGLDDAFAKLIIKQATMDKAKAWSDKQVAERKAVKIISKGWKIFTIVCAILCGAAFLVWLFKTAIEAVGM